MTNVPLGFGASDRDDQPEEPGPGKPGPDAFDMAAIGAALQQLGSMLQSGASASAGPVDWTIARNAARQSLEAAGDPVVSDAQRRQVADAMGLADVWTDAATQFPACPGPARAWSRSEWLDATLPAWQDMIAPVAEQFSRTIEQILPGGQAPGPGQESPPATIGFTEGLPPELAAAAGPLLGMARSLGAAMFGTQAGQGLAALATEVLSLADVGVPLATDCVAAILPGNLVTFGAGLGLPEDDILLFVALREGAHQRLFAHVPWLRSRVASAIEAYCAGLRIDRTKIEEAIGDLDPANPEALQQMIAEGVLMPQDTEERRAALARLETLLALIEGWVDDVVLAAAADRLPSHSRLSEVLRRRRATGGPAEKTFATLVGLDLRPRRLREAASLWRHLREAGSIQKRDALWGHPDLLPSAGDLDDIAGFIDRQADQ